MRKETSDDSPRLSLFFFPRGGENSLVILSMRKENPAGIFFLLIESRIKCIS